MNMILFLVSCGANTEVGKFHSQSNEAIGKEITGVVLELDGGEFDLEQDLSEETDTLVLIFAQDTCHLCSDEANTLSAKIDEINGISKGVEIITFLIGLKGDRDIDIDIASDWKRAHNVQWRVVLQKGEDNVFRRYFPGFVSVPAVIVQKEGKVSFQHSGTLEFDVLEREIGGLE